MREDAHRWDDLDDRERRDLAPLHGDTPGATFDAQSLEARITLRSVRLAMDRQGVGGRLWDEVRSILWVSPNQIGMVVADAWRFREMVRRATRPDGAPLFRADPGWLLLMFKHEADWSVRESGATAWGLQLYRRGPDRREYGEIVADLDRAPLTGGILAHLGDVRRPTAAESHPTFAWEAIRARLADPAPAVDAG